MRFICRAAGSALLLALGLAAAAAPPERVVIADRRLDQQVEVSQPFGTLSGYLKAVSAKSSVPHQVKPPHGDRALVALGPPISLRELQKAMARDLMLSWERKGASYHLSESARDRKLRRDAWEKKHASALTAMVARFRHKASLINLSDEELARRAAARDPFAHLARQDRARHRGSVADKVRFITSLPQGVLEKAFAGAVVDVRYNQLSRENQARFMQVTRGFVGRPLRQHEIPEHGAMRLFLSGTWSRPELQVKFRFDKGGGGVTTLTATSVDPDPADRRLGMQWARVPEHPEFKKKITLTDTGRPKGGYFSGGERPPNALPMQPLLKQLSEQVNLPIIAECDYKLKDPLWLAKQWWMLKQIKDEPLSRALDLLCADFEYEWEFREGVLLLRPVPGAGSSGKNFRPNVPAPPHPVPAAALNPRPPI